MGNIPSQERVYYEREAAHVAVQLLQHPEVRHVVQSLGDYFRHHGDYVKHKKNRSRKRETREREEYLLGLGQRQMHGGYGENDRQKGHGIPNSGSHWHDSPGHGGPGRRGGRGGSRSGGRGFHPGGHHPDGLLFIRACRPRESNPFYRPASPRSRTKQSTLWLSTPNKPIPPLTTRRSAG